MSTLGMKEDKFTDSFMVFEKDVQAYVLDNYKKPSNIAYLIK